MASDVLHDALVGWVAGEEKTSSFISSLISHLSKEDATKLICMFLRAEPEWLEENVSANEAIGALEEAMRLNDWTEMLQIMTVLDTIKIDEVMRIWQTVKDYSRE